MKITNAWLKKYYAGKDRYKWAQSQKERGLKPFIDALMADNHFDWANWVLVRCLNEKQKVQYAVFAAEQVEYLWKDKYPTEYKIWKEWVDSGLRGGASAGAAARAAAWDVVRAAWDVGDSARATARAAWAAARVVGDATRAVGDAVWAVGDAVGDAAKKELETKIINYGLKFGEKRGRGKNDRLRPRRLGAQRLGDKF